MNKTAIFSLWAVFILGLTACGDNESEKTAEDDATTETTGSSTSTASYSAQADSFRMNSEAGNYLDAQTGKPVKINVDTATGARTNAETGEPIGYYVDKRNWWVYGNDSWDTVGSARMEGSNLKFRDMDDKWVSYDKKWKLKTEDMKIKAEKDGDMKMKTEDTKIKAEDGEIKVKER